MSRQSIGEKKVKIRMEGRNGSPGAGHDEHGQGKRQMKKQQQEFE